MTPIAQSLLDSIKRWSEYRASKSHDDAKNSRELVGTALRLGLTVDEARESLEGMRTATCPACKTEHAIIYHDDDLYGWPTNLPPCEVCGDTPAGICDGCLCMTSGEDGLVHDAGVDGYICPTCEREQASEL